ncbi:MAG TPA: hypothetical protein ENF87_01410, partial [Thermoproteales archaeon]|nr:hypothetical protein [Thermoproteales archaeon]
MNIPRRFRRGGFLGRFLFFFGVFIFLLVGGLLGYGYYSENIKPLREKVMEIDSEVISMDEYVKYLKFYGIGDVRKELRLLFSMNVEREIYE